MSERKALRDSWRSRWDPEGIEVWLYLLQKDRARGRSQVYGEWRESIINQTGGGRRKEKKKKKKDK